MNNKAIANLGCLLILALTMLACTKQNQQALQQRWTIDQANEWYDEFPFLVGQFFPFFDDELNYLKAGENNISIKTIGNSELDLIDVAVFHY